MGTPSAQHRPSLPGTDERPAGGGDPAKLAKALGKLASQDQPPLRFVAGADAMAAVEKKAKDLLVQVVACRELSRNLTIDDACVTAGSAGGKPISDGPA